MNANLATLAYLVCGVLFILALRGLSSPVTSRFIGSVTVTGTSTISTFIRISDPGRACAEAAPLMTGASTPVGAPVAGVLVEGGGTWTLFSGSSWAHPRVRQKLKSARAHTTARNKEDGALCASNRWRSGFIGSHLGMKASLARPAGARAPPVVPSSALTLPPQNR